MANPEIINFCVVGAMSECSEKKDHAKQKKCSYYDPGASHCGNLRFEYHCDCVDAQKRVKERLS